LHLHPYIRCYNTLYDKAKFLRYWRVILFYFCNLYWKVIYLIFCVAEKKIAHVRYVVILLPNFLLEIHWPFVMKGIYIQPAWATKEIRLNIQDVEKSRSDQIKIFGSGMLWPRLLIPNIWIVAIRKIFWTTSYFLLW
jgi:hypothetical protein